MKKWIEVSDADKFKLWFDYPIKQLESIKGGHGGFCALMVALPLYERFYRYAVSKGAPDNRPEWVKNDLLLKTTDEAKMFWQVFRDGLCHTGSFFEETRDYKKEDLPSISLDEKHSYSPKFLTREGIFIVELNPWKFWKHVLDKYTSDPGVLDYAKAPLLPLHMLSAGVDKE